MSAPLFLVTVPFVLGMITFLMRRWPQIAGPVAAGAAWLVALVLRGYELSPETSGASWELFGQVLALTERSQQLLVAVYMLIGIIVLLSAFYDQGDKFVALSLATLSPLSAALMVESIAIGAVLIFIAAGGMAMLIQGSRAGSTLAALRFFSLVALAMPLLLVAGWMIGSDQYQFPDTVTLMILVSLLLLTTAFPFQIWVAPVVRESSSLATSVVYGLGQLVVLFYCLKLLVDQPFVFGSSEFQTVLSLSAAATLLLGAVLTMTARSFGHQLGYLLLLSIGAVTAVIGSGDAAVVEAAVTLLLLRVIALIIAGVGLAMVRTRALSVAGGVSQYAANQGLAWRAPLAIGLFAFGSFSLAGLPLTPGFAGSWPAVVVVARNTPWLAAILVLSIAGGAFGVIRRLIPLLSHPEDPAHDQNVVTESKQEQVIGGVILGAAVLVTIFPRIILAFAGNLADLF
ncbi:MAG: proton-conducting transporter membrane subunit [Chloroflexota bacterium]|jgi:NADH:ubiquinone oxidoreductase subunit 2 (subunit N)